MALVAKNLGNTGSTTGNRVVWDFRTTNETLELDSEFPAADLLATSAHQYGQAPGYSGVFMLTRIKSVLVYGGVDVTITFATSDSITFGPGFHEFSDVGGLPIGRIMTNSTASGSHNDIEITAGQGAVVELRK